MCGLFNVLSNIDKLLMHTFDGGGFSAIMSKIIILKRSGSVNLRATFQGSPSDVAIDMLGYLHRHVADQRGFALESAIVQFQLAANMSILHMSRVKTLRKKHPGKALVQLRDRLFGLTPGMCMWSPATSHRTRNLNTSGG